MESRGAIWRWLALGVAVVLLVVALNRLFPSAVSGARGWSSVAYMAGLIVLLSAGALRFQPHRVGPFLQAIAGWVAIGSLLLLAYAYRDALGFG